MDATPTRKAVAGIFKDETAAARAVKMLVEAHFDPDRDVTVIASHHHERENIPVGSTFLVGRNAAIGALIGAAVTGIGVALAGLTSGPFTLEEAGPLMAALESAFVGGGVGFALGALLSIDFVRVGANFGRAHVHGGVVYVGVYADGARAERARRVLSDAGAKHFMDHLPELATA